MRVISQERVEGFGISLAPVMVVSTLIFVFCMAILMIFRQHCISEGYKISELAIELDKKALEYEAVSQQYSDALRWEVLFDRAEKMNFIFPAGGKVFYVQQ